LEAVHYFSDPDRALEFVKALRWPNGNPVCPTCGCLDQSFLKTRRIWKCKGCKRQFSVKRGTIFEDSPIGFDKWLPCIWLLANSKNSISSYEAARSLGVSQKTAWFMLHRIRLAMESGTFAQLSGTVEVDETYVGGRGRNVHRSRPIPPKTAVQGARERGSGKVTAAVVSTGELRANVYSWIAPGSTVYTDEARAYWNLGGWYQHDHVMHQGPMATRYAKHGIVHTNGIENFWSVLKRAIKGSQIHVSPAHLDRYVTEREFAYNFRSESDLSRMAIALAGAPGRRLTYSALKVRG
jgi:transposase-like protein